MIVSSLHVICLNDATEFSLNFWMVDTSEGLTSSRADQVNCLSLAHVKNFLNVQCILKIFLILGGKHSQFVTERVTDRESHQPSCSTPPRVSVSLKREAKRIGTN